MMRPLPYDIVCVVFRFLPAEAVALCARACSEWRQAALAERKRRTLGLADAALAWVKANPGELVLAGSMALWLSEGAPTRWFPGDADVFYHSGLAQDTPGPRRQEKHISCGEQAFGFLCGKKIHEDHPRERVVNHATPDGTVQFVLLFVFKDAVHVLESFDLSCCMVGYTARGVGIRGPRFASPKFTSFHWPGDERKPYSHLSEQLIISQDARTHARARKYERRGYAHAGRAFATLHQMRFAIVYERRNKQARDIRSLSFHTVFDRGGAPLIDMQDFCGGLRGHTM